MKLIKNKNLCKNIIVIAIMVCIIVGFVYYDNYSNHLHNLLKETTEENESLKTQVDKTNKDLESVKDELKTAYEKLYDAHEEIKMQSEEIKKQSEEIEKYKKEIEEHNAKWVRRHQEYPVATEVWILMKDRGWSDVVCAGIMGNLMAETGGSGTLHLNWDSEDGKSYGLVQWIDGRRNTIKSIYGEFPSIEEQVQFMYDELYGTNGVKRQVTNSQFNAIMNAETPEECAYAFACYYERCAEQYRSMRRGFARKAYEYFVD